MASRSATAQRLSRPRMLLVAGLATVGIGAGQLSLALFTDTETVDGTFTAGTIVLDGTRIDGLTLTTGALMPGDMVTDDVVVENDGSAQLRYAVSASSTNPDTLALRDALTLEIRGIDATTPGVPCDNFDGALLASEAALGGARTVLGNPASGSHSGDRTLDAAASETLCFRVKLPSNAAATYQGATTATTFTFDAEQTANNP